MMREYTIETAGVEITVQLSDEEAKQRGLKPSGRKAVPDKAEPAKRSAATKRAAVVDSSFTKKSRRGAG